MFNLRMNNQYNVICIFKENITEIFVICMTTYFNVLQCMFYVQCQCTRHFNFCKYTPVNFILRYSEKDIYNLYNFMHEIYFRLKINFNIFKLFNIQQILEQVQFKKEKEEMK